MATTAVDANLRSDAAAILNRFKTLQNDFKDKSPQEFKRDMSNIANDVEQVTQLRTRVNHACKDRALVPGLSDSELLEVYKQWSDASKIVCLLEESRLIANCYEELSQSSEAQEKNFDAVTVGQLVTRSRSILYQSATPGIQKAFDDLNQRLMKLLSDKVPDSVHKRPSTPDLRARTDEESFLTHLLNAWNTGAKDFNSALQLYQNAAAYLAGKKGSNQFASEMARSGFSDFSKKMKETMTSKIAEQKAIEEEARKRLEEYDSLTKFTPVYDALCSNATSQFQFNQALAQAYKALTEHLRASLKNAVAEKTGANLSDKKYLDDKQFTLVNWPGTLEQKKAAVKSLIPDALPPSVPQHSLEMEATMNAALSSHSTMLDPAVSASLAQGIDDLQRVIELFELEKFNDAQFGMAKLASKNLSLNGTNMADRVNFHMYVIHQTAGKPINDPDYGANAFQGKIPGENSERILAIRRTMIEGALAGLKEAYAANQTADIKAYLNLLETKQELIDAASRNPAHQLYGAVYQIYSTAHNQNPTLHDPNDGSVFGDFGRSVMSNAVPIDTQFKLDAVRKVQDELKTLWKF